MFQVKVASEKLSVLFQDVLIVILSSILIGLFGQIAIPLPFTPVPMATQPQLILLLAVFLGPRRAFASVLLFLVQGAVGLPVFAGGVGGIFKLLGPTGGYLIGYLMASLATGFLVEKMKEKTTLKVFTAMALGNIIIFAMGALYLATFVGLQKALLLGVAPFLLGDLIKLTLSAKIFERFRV